MSVVTLFPFPGGGGGAIVAPAFNQAGTPLTGFSGSPNASQTFSITCDVGDLLIVLFKGSGGNGGAFTAISAGWVEVPNVAYNGGGNNTMYAYYMFATETSHSVTCTTDGTEIGGVIAAFSNVDPSSPFEADHAGVVASSTTSATAPSITTAQDNSLVVILLTEYINGLTTSDFITGQTNANLVGLTENIDWSRRHATGDGVGLLSGVLPTAGVAGSTAITFSHNVSGRVKTIAIKGVTA